MAPHAGYMYSGAVAGALYGALELPSSFIILCPNHSGEGEQQAVCNSGEWITPLGRAKVDAELAATVCRECPALREDAYAHAREHSLEVQLPFLQHEQPSFTFVPIALGRVHFAELQELGQGLARAVAAAGRPILLVASSDMNHYERDSVTRAKDQQAIDAILALDPRRLYDVLIRDSNSMCGYGPVIAMLTAAQKLGANRAQLIRYATSADAGGPRDSVVGYAAIAIYRDASL